MAAKRNLWTFLGAEHYKFWRNPAVWAMIGYPLLATVLAMLNVYSNREQFAPTELNPWILYSGRFIVMFYLLYPILTAILCWSLFDAEYSRNNFRQLFTLPYKRWTVYLGKMIFMIEVVALAMGVGVLVFLAHGPILQTLIPAALYSDHEIIPLILSYFSRLFVSLVFIALLQYFLTAAFRNFVMPIGISCFMVIFTIIAYKLKVGFLIPYFSAHHLINEFLEAGTALDKYDFVVLAYLPIFFVANYFMMRRIYRN